jgi:hypothetical protein
MAKEDCEDGLHLFEWDYDYEQNIEYDECIRIPVTCKKCKLKAHEVFHESIYADRKTGEPI